MHFTNVFLYLKHQSTNLNILLKPVNLMSGLLVYCPHIKANPSHNPFLSNCLLRNNPTLFSVLFCPLYITLNCNVCPLYIPISCNVCPLYIPINCNVFPLYILLIVMSVPCTFNLFDSLFPVHLKALNPFENSSKVWKSISKYVSEQLTRTFAVLVW